MCHTLDDAQNLVSIFQVTNVCLCREKSNHSQREGAKGETHSLRWSAMEAQISARHHWEMTSGAGLTAAPENCWAWSKNKQRF